MRPYATVSPLFWTGATGKRLRKNADAQRVALYLMTSPHAHQSGLYYLPLMYLCHEVGIDEEGAKKALEWLSSESFCEYDQESEWIWVCEMAAWQIGTELTAQDKRCKGVQQFLQTVPSLPFVQRFIERYAEDYHLKTSPLQAPSEGASSEQNRTEQNIDRRAERATRIPDDFLLTPERRLVAEAERLPAERTFATFRDYWVAKPGKAGRKLDWDATWRVWCRNQFSRPQQQPAKKNPFDGAVQG